MHRFGEAVITDAESFPPIRDLVFLGQADQFGVLRGGVHPVVSHVGVSYCVWSTSPFCRAASHAYRLIVCTVNDNERTNRGLRETPCARILRAAPDASRRRIPTHGKALPRAGLSLDRREHAKHKRSCQLAGLSASRRPSASRADHWTSA